MDPSYFSPDILEFLKLLSLHEVRYLIVGGEAVIYYGHARLTGDVDIFYDLAKENTERLFRALKVFWEGDIPEIAKPEEFQKKGAIVQFGRPPHRIDLINDISGVFFERAWLNRTVEEVMIKDKAYPVIYIGLEELITNKRNANRYKDLEDLKYLTAIDKKQ
jgi:predicted nucleotidyltransferase